MGWSERERWRAPAAAMLAVVVAGGTGCADEPGPSTTSGTLAGRVVVSGPLRHAAVAVDQLDIKTGQVRDHVGDTETGDDGRFALDTGVANGLLRITARGGSFTDLATGATIQLDAADELGSLATFELLEVRDDVLVSPVGHLIDVRAQGKLAELGDLGKALDDAAGKLGRHFGNVDWLRGEPASLDQKATSPTEAVRAALVQAALSVLVKDIAMEAGASPQEVNVFRLTRLWADDIAADVFDGNDHNDRRDASGLQLGTCAPVEPACVVPGAGCATGACRRLCDLYVGTPRALLGGEMTKVIQDRGPGGLNQTGLAVADTLAIARSVSDDVDGELFGDACIETLDRLPPTVTFETPGGAAYVRGKVAVRVAAVDDTDPTPRAQIVGYPDLDGDPTNAVAQATIDTAAGVAEGALEIRAIASDLAGNRGMASRMVMVDNTAPVVTLSATGFFVDGATWWTASATPVLHGTVSDRSPVTIAVTVAGGATVAGTVTGTSWSAALPAGSLDGAGTQVTIVAVDAAGNAGSTSQRLRPDVTPPQLSFAASAVNDEASEPVTFPVGDPLDATPTHSHTGPPRDLAAAGTCPSVTKYSYLLGETAPAYAIEQPARNPIRYQLLTDDPGVGIATGSTQYRVGRRSGGTTSWVLDWTSAGAGVPVGTTVRRFAVGMFSNVISGLGTTPGTYEVELRATDRLSRTTTVGRCFELGLKAPPLRWTANDGGKPTTVHDYALDSLSLAAGSSFDKLAARLLNDDATGASVIDQRFSNGTARTVYLTVTVTRPNLVKARKRFRDGYVEIRNERGGAACVEGEPACEPPLNGTYDSNLAEEPIGNQAFPVKVFELVNGVPATEVACLAPCPVTGTSFSFAIPPRATGGQPSRQFLAMTMVDKVPQLRPSDLFSPSLPPYQETSYTWTSTIPNQTRTYRVTGALPEPPQTVSGCIEYRLDDDGVIIGCARRGTYRRARVVLNAGLEFTSDIKSRYATAPAPQLTPEPAAPDGTRSSIPQNVWATAEEGLP